VRTSAWNLSGGGICSLFFVGIFLAAPSSCASSSQVLQTTVCAIAAAPSEFAGKTVSIEATVEVSYHMRLLVDDRCPQVGISLDVSDKVESQREVREFMKILHAQNRGPGEPSRVSATLTGRFSTRPGEPPNRILELRSVANVKIKQ